MRSFVGTVAMMAMWIMSVSAANNWATYPPVPKTASWNGFADMVIDRYPACAKECVKMSTKITPCPYWDTGCLCVMPQWSGSVALCIAQNCTGEDVAIATSVALSVCSSVGANTWMMPASVSTILEEAVEDVATANGGSAASTASAEATSEASSEATSESSVTGTTSAASSESSASSSSADSSSAGSSSSASSTSAGEGATVAGGVQAALWAIAAQAAMAVAAM